jgi:hypothetical protein
MGKGFRPVSIEYFVSADLPKARVWVGATLEMTLGYDRYGSAEATPGQPAGHQQHRLRTLSEPATVLRQSARNERRLGERQQGTGCWPGPRSPVKAEG